MPRVDTSKLLPIEQAPKDGTWIWAYYPPVMRKLAGTKNKRPTAFPEMILPARWSKPRDGNFEYHWMIGNRWSPGDSPTHFFPMTQPPMIEE
ncbi:hypothetical protein PUR29_35105 [Methylobacterium ajmalii]|uniref:Uncharacterized protein n=1 Tax=Methylobacterium ajmalii TaxID=2738439 RepID=A0ABV0A5B8_9HYPH